MGSVMRYSPLSPNLVRTGHHPVGTRHLEKPFNINGGQDGQDGQEDYETIRGNALHVVVSLLQRGNVVRMS